MPRSPKTKNLSSPTREKLARASKDRPKVESPTSPRKSPRKSPTKTPTKKSPKKEKTPKKELSDVKSPKKSPSSASKKNYSHPTYEAMIRKAIKEDATRKGTSYIAIYKFVDANYQVPANYQTHVRNNLKKLIEDGTLDHGATPQRYKLSAKTRLEDKKSTPKKKKEPSSPRKSSRSSKSEESPIKKKKTSKSEGDSPKKKSTPSSSPKKTPTKRSPKKEKESPSKSTRSAKKETPTKKTPTRKAASPRGGVEKKTPPKTPRGSAKKASPLSSPSASGGGASESGDLKWTWQYYDNGYFNYSPTASAVVEGVYQEYLSSPYTTDVRSVKSGQWSYLVDFREMTQQNVEHENHTKRKIRRVQIPASQTSDLKRKYDGDDGSLSD